jgi:RNA polymerase sporulation-specific sigma factor
MQRSKKEADKLYFKCEHYVPVTLERAFPNYREFAKTHGLDTEDLLQLGKIGLFKAAQEYNPNKKASFKTYAIKKIRFTIMTESKRYSINNKDNRTYELSEKTSMEYPLATTDGEVVDLHDVVEAKSDAFDEIELEMMLQEVSDVVSKDVAVAVKMRYQGFTFSEIGDSLGLSAQRIQQLLKMNRQTLCDYLLA